MNNKIKYRIRFSFNLENAIKPIGDLIKSLNYHMSNMGYNEKLNVRSRSLYADMQVDRELLKTEKKQMGETMLKFMNERFPSLEWDITSFRRQSCRQSHNKSTCKS